MKKIFLFSELHELLSRWRTEGVEVVFTNGCFDLLHPGHLDYLEAARSLGGRLIVGLNSDASIRRLKGEERPILPEGVRARMLAGLAAVDAVILFEEDTPLQLIQAVKPNLLVKGGDYTLAEIVGHKEVLATGGSVKTIPLTAGFSTSDLIQKIRTHAKAIDISIPMRFNGPQPSTYGVPPATAAAYRDGNFVGDVNQGGSCNFEIYHFTPHCNGTHTECVGHISEEKVFIHEVLQQSMIPALLISISPTSPSETQDTYDPPLAESDRLIDKESLQAFLGKMKGDISALIIRTLPNTAGKKARDYMEVAPPFFTNQAMEYLVKKGVKHLLVDMPSVDRLFDEGKMTNHHIYWDVKQGTHQVPAGSARAKQCTITEMIFVPDEVTDGKYLLEIQIPAFMTDAAPSRVRLFG